MTGRVMSEAESSLQIELDSGKRVKVKSANLLLKFEKPAPAALMASAQALAEQIELDLAWEFAPEQEFGFAELAADYFQDPPTIEQQVAVHGDDDVAARGIDAGLHRGGLAEVAPQLDHMDMVA